jgi:hypothetical protein
MDAVVANSATDHVDDVACYGRLNVAFSAVWKASRHDSDGTTVDQWFADVTVIENDGSIDGWYSRFIPADSNACVNTTEHT